MNTLFNTDLNDTSVPKVPQDTKTVDITPVYFGNKRRTPFIHYNYYLKRVWMKFTHLYWFIDLLELEEEGVKLNLCLVDTPGFGDRLNRKEEYVLFLVEHLASTHTYICITGFLERAIVTK